MSPGRSWWTLVLLAFCSFVAGPTAASAQQVAATTSLAGIVLVDSTERPIAGAEVELIGTTFRARSDSSGAFFIAGVPPGSYRLQVRAVGYSPILVDLALGREKMEDVDILLRPVAQELERVDVRAALTPTARNLLGFESRRKFGIGKFLDSTALWRFGDRQWAQAIVAQSPGVRATSYGASSALTVGSRGPSSPRNGLPSGDVVDIRRGAKPACYMRVYVDGVLHYNSQAGESLFDVTNYNGPQIVAAEVYTAAQLPAEFNRMGAASCGAVLLWTKR
ncbi:MAG: carboxypeptidase-like regulatory domain-containing protein [Gemmatimonadaceae bacterium]|nr:carboxypeptidase-like regulatory domain-containing protein [Gemmatimonadaceae bacterium]